MRPPEDTAFALIFRIMFVVLLLQSLWPIRETLAPLRKPWTRSEPKKDWRKARRKPLPAAAVCESGVCVCVYMISCYAEQKSDWTVFYSYNNVLHEQQGLIKINCHAHKGSPKLPQDNRTVQKCFHLYITVPNNVFLDIIIRMNRNMVFNIENSFVFWHGDIMAHFKVKSQLVLE